ncbi:hypothetical protein ACIA5D_12150 [Actinoplanes sp. NPDC051513]|uniref:hypothetical protein n=1 Tax=Actinoplanes sp. NPDC051513 TaxID=3363908 RepID=UPI0037BB46F0
MSAPAELCFAQRFRGPPGVTNGGFGCGSLAALLDSSADVTLRRPLPLERALTVRRDGDGLVLSDGAMLLAEARPSAIDVALVMPADVTAAQARAAAGTARYYADPVFPECFVCGPARGPADGLRIFPGPVPGNAMHAAPWTLDPSVAGPDSQAWPEVVWAALDCPSGVAAAAAVELHADTAVVLGRMTANVAALPNAGDECRVVAWPLGHEGRKLTAGSALLGPDGRVLAAAKALWITVPRPLGAGRGTRLQTYGRGIPE